MNAPLKVTAEEPTKRPIETLDIFRAPGPLGETTVDPEAYALETSLRSLIGIGDGLRERSTQTGIGMSEIGYACDRRISYRLANTPASNYSDPLRALVGTAWHTVAAEMFGRLSGKTGRFVVEQHVRYRGIPGTVDLYDRLTRDVVDWKTTLKSKLARVRANGPLQHYVVQLHGYGAALVARGETVRDVALAYVPVDGTLDDIWVWRTPLNVAVADEAIARVNALHGSDPANVTASPNTLCTYCPFFRSGSTDLSVACPGHDPVRKP